MASPIAPQSVTVTAGAVRSEFDTQARRQSRVILGRFLRHRLAMVSLTVLILLVLVTFVMPFFWPYNYQSTASGGYLVPSAAHPLGTNQVGNDTVAQVLRGTKISLLIALMVAIASTTIGVIAGTVSGYLRGFFDLAIQRLVDLFLILPQLAAVALLVNKFGGSWYTVAIVLAMWNWMYMARISRGEALSLSQREFVEAARAAGAGPFHIIFRHLVPNMIGTISVNATLTVALAVLQEAILSFIGLGVRIPETSLGLILQGSAAQILDRPWLFWAPAVVIVLISLTINFIGDGMRDAFDPAQKKVRT